MNNIISYCTLAICLFFMINITVAQVDGERCTTMQALQQRIESNSRYAAYHNDALAMPKIDRQGQIPCDANNSIVVPVAFHFAPGVVTCGDSDCLLAEVQDQLDAMNVAFGNNTGSAAEAVCPAAYQDAQGNSVASTGTCITFCLAVPPEGNAEGLDPACDPPITIGAFTGGFGAGGQGAPGWNGIMNLFITSGNCLGVADGIPGAANGDGVSTCAEAFGGTDPSSGCGLDTQNTYNLGATMIHEIGHYLGLFHTHVDGAPSCNDNDVNAPGPFNVNDTPIMADQFYGCPTGCVTNTSQGTGGTCGAINVPTANFMAYTDDACMSMFTEDQAAVMNYWANQLFGATANQCSAPSPPELPNACLNQPCEVACATAVTTPVAITDDFCGMSDVVAFPDPEANGLVLDDNSDAIYSWSTGNYLSAGGTAIAAPNTLTSTNCIIETETYFLNVDCTTTPLNPTLDGGTYIITAYPAPPTDLTTLVTVSGEGTCNEPILTPLAGCEAYVTVTPDAGNPTFPVNNGDSGTASYTVTFVPDAAGPDCCFAGEDAVIIDATMNDGDLEAIGAGGASPWTSTSTNFGTVLCDAGTCGNGGGSINYGVAPNSGAYLAWFGGSGNQETGTLSGDFVIPPCPGGMATLTFALENSVCGDAADFIQVQVDGNVEFTLNTNPANCDANGTIQTITVNLSAYADGASHTILFTSDSGAGGVATNFTVDNIMLVNVGCDSGLTCDVIVTADYNCDSVGVPYCDNLCFAEFNPNPGADDTADPSLCVTPLGCADNPDATCLQTLACDDMDSCTENEMETTIIETGEVCTACGNGTPIATCTLPAVAQACDDGDPCTENDMEEVDACDAAVVCVPCAGTAVASCALAPVMQACDDGDPCTTGEMEGIDACDNVTVCVPCGNGMAVTPACGDPVATNFDPNATCIDNTVCTFGMFCDNPCFAEFAPNPNPGDIADPALCVTALGCADLAGIDPSCISIDACDDSDPCTANEQATTILATGEVCTDCGLNSTPVTAACGDPAATNFDPNATCIDNTLCTFGAYCDNPCFAEFNPNPGASDTADPTLCVTALGCADLAGIDATCISIDACDDGDPCTENEQATTILATGEVCADCGLNATPVTAACGDITANNYDPTATCIDNNLCTYDSFAIDITDPCSCMPEPTAPQNVDFEGDGIIDLVADEITITGPPGSTWCLTANPMPVAEDMTGAAYGADGTVCAVEDPANPGTYTLTVYHSASGTGYGPVTFTDQDSNELMIGNATGCECICEDSIEGTIFTDEPMCSAEIVDFSGISVIIIDVATGMPVAGSPVLTDAMGNYTLVGPFACGNYTAELDPATLPTCYASLDGEVGPLPFSINGDGTADGPDFSNIVQIPTLSQWGLISLALLLMIFGAVTLGATTLNTNRVRK